MNWTHTLDELIKDYQNGNDDAALIAADLLEDNGHPLAAYFIRQDRIPTAAPQEYIDIIMNPAGR